MNFNLIRNPNFKKDDCIRVRLPKHQKRELEACTDNISALVRDLITDYLDKRETKTFKIKKNLKAKKTAKETVINNIETHEKELKEYKAYLKEINTEIVDLAKELKNNGVEETPELTKNEGLNNLIHNRIIKPYLKSRYNNIIDYVNNNFNSISKTANRFGLKIGYNELINLLKQNKVKKLLKCKNIDYNNNNNNNKKNIINNNKESIYECVTVSHKNVAMYPNTA